MQWSVNLEGAPRRVNHAAVLLDDNNIYSFGGYCSNDNPQANSPIDIHVLNTTTLRWTRIYSKREMELQRNGGRRVMTTGRGEAALAPPRRINDNSLMYAVSDDDMDIADMGMVVRRGGGVNGGGGGAQGRLGPGGAVPAGAAGPVGGLFAPHYRAPLVPHPNRINPMEMNTDDEDEDEDEEEEEDSEESEEDDPMMGGDGAGVAGGAPPIPNRAMPMADMIKQDTRDLVPYHRYGHTVVVFEGKAYLWGGRNDDNGASDVLHCFDPVDFSWTSLHTTGRCPPARDGHSAVVHGRSMIVFGGFEEESQRFSNETFVYDFDLKHWTEMRTTGDRPQWRDFHTAAVIDEKMYVFGGRCDQMGQFHSTRDLYEDALRVLDLKTQVWSLVKTTGDVPTGRRSHSAFVFKGRMYIFGGFLGTRNKHYNDLYSFDPATKVWKKMVTVGNAPCERRRQCTVVVDDRLFLFGGTKPTTTGPPVPNSGPMSQLSDLSDLYVLDFEPTLYQLAARQVLEKVAYKRYLYALPSVIRNDLLNRSGTSSYYPCPRYGSG